MRRRGGETLRRHLGETASGARLRPVSRTECAFQPRPEWRFFDRSGGASRFPFPMNRKDCAFGCRALRRRPAQVSKFTGTRSIRKAILLYHLDRAKEGIRRQDLRFWSKGIWMRSRWHARDQQRGRELRHDLAEPRSAARAFHAARHRELRPGHAGQTATGAVSCTSARHDFEVRVARAAAGWQQEG